MLRQFVVFYIYFPMAIEVIKIKEFFWTCSDVRMLKKKSPVFYIFLPKALEITRIEELFEHAQA